jgi:hypothetical protein
MEYMGDMNQLNEEQRLALHSVIAAFTAYDAFRSQETGKDEPEPTLDLTAIDLMGIIPSGHNFEDIYIATRQDFLNKAPSSRTRLTPRKKHLR